ncbi:hypothetical protein FGB62_62g224 [Gracilaria domingensis]|nr:hypothetical protein FGB62_62g224 [Gracilaria domingensis]
MVRKSLDSFEHFRRRRSLHRGQPVTLPGLRFDRYNLVKTLTARNSFSTWSFFSVIVLAYGVEIALEYAVDSRSIRYPIRANITRLPYSTNSCSNDVIFSGENALDLAFIAEQCVVFEDDKYRLYSPVWITGSNGRRELLCEPVQQNRLYQGAGVHDLDAMPNDPDMANLRQTLLANSTTPVGNRFHSLIVLKVSSDDVRRRNSFSTPDGRISVAFFMTNITGTNVVCFGFASGRAEQHSAVVQLRGCSTGFDENSSLAITYGTSFVEQGLNTDWSTQIGFEIRILIPKYFKGIASNIPSSNATALGYAALLSRAFAQDVINLNKYAIVYQHCDQIQLPVQDGTSREEEYEFAGSEVRVTATVEKWGIVLAVCWVIAVTLARILITWLAERSGMPGNVFGEGQILRRWAEENSGVEPTEKGVGEPILSVKDDMKPGHVTATLRLKSTKR